MPHQGPPKWDGTYVDIDPIAGKFFPVVLGQPFVISINDSNDLFFTLYTTEEKLKETTGKILAKLDMPNKYTIGTVRETKDFIDAILEGGIRIMCDPIVVDDNHTKWSEIVKEGDQYKFLDPQRN